MFIGDGRTNYFTLYLSLAASIFHLIIVQIIIF